MRKEKFDKIFITICNPCKCKKGVKNEVIKKYSESLCCYIIFRAHKDKIKSKRWALYYNIVQVTLIFVRQVSQNSKLSIFSNIKISLCFEIGPNYLHEIIIFLHWVPPPSSFSKFTTIYRRLEMLDIASSSSWKLLTHWVDQQYDEDLAFCKAQFHLIPIWT